MNRKIVEEEVKWDIPYDKERPIPFVKHCGKTFAEITDREELYILTSDLTENEKKSAFAEYYFMGPACPTEDNIRATEYGTAIPPQEAFMLEEYAKHMDVSGGCTMKTGYCVMENGIGFASACTITKGVTPEVMSHFMDEFNPRDDLYYKAWYPGAHVRHYEDMAIEDLGFGMVQLRFVEGLNVEDIGMKFPADKDEAFIGLTGANMLCQPLHQPDAEPIYLTETCYYRQYEDTYELRVNFWIGMWWKDGKSILHLPEGKPVQELYPLSFAKHSVWETATFMRNVLEFSKKEK